METLLEHIVALATVLIFAGIACFAFIVSPYEIQFEDSEDLEEI